MRRAPNNKKNPDIALLDNPVGIDRIIQTLQVSFSNNLNWLEKSFGRAYTQTRKNPKQDRIISNDNIYYPAAYQGVNANNRVKDFEDLLVNDNLDSYCFFRTRTDEELEEGEYYGQVRNRFTRELSVIFWFNMDRINKQPGQTPRLYPFQEELNTEIKEVISETIFNPNARIELIRVVDDPREIYEGYSIDIVEKQNLSYPNWGYRYDLRAFYDQEC